MSRIFIDGFEAGSLDLWDIIAGCDVAESIGNMDGTYCADLQGANTDAMIRVLPADSEYYFGMRYKNTAVTGTSPVIAFYNDTTKLAEIKKDCANGVLTAYVGGALVDTGTEVFGQNETILLEARYLIHDSTGIIQCKVNSILDIDYSGDTKPGNDATMTKIRLGDVGEVNEYPHAYYDNIIVDDATWPGNTRIVGLVPTAEGNSTEWTPSVGDNYTCVDEIPPSDADYNYSNTIDQLDLYNVGDLSGTPTVVCVQTQARVEAMGSPTPTSIQLACRTESTDYVGSSQSVPSSPTAFCKLWEDNPNTSSPWTYTQINAMEIGIKAVA